MTSIFKVRPLSVNTLLAAACGVGLFLHAGFSAATMLDEPANPVPSVEQSDLITKPAPSEQDTAPVPVEPDQNADKPPATTNDPATPTVDSKPEPTPESQPAQEVDQPAPAPNDDQPDAAPPVEEIEEPQPELVPAPPEKPATPPLQQSPVRQSEQAPEAETGSDPVETARRLRLGLDGPPDVTKALDLLHAASVRGNSWAMFALAELYRTGDGVPADPEKAEGLYHRAREGADPAAANLAAYGLGQLYSQGPLRNPPKAVEHYRRAVEAKNPWGMYALAEIYRTGEGVPAVSEEAEILYRDAIKAGDAEAASSAAYGLGELYSQGPLHNPVKAARAYRQAADAGHPWALYALAECYREGIGVKADTGKAEDLLLRATKAGDPDAAKASAYTLGGLYSGDGPLPNPQKALRYYGDAAAGGNAWAMLALAEIYEKGIGVEANDARRREFYVSAIETGDPEVAELATRALAPPPAPVAVDTPPSSAITEPGEPAPEEAIAPPPADVEQPPAVAGQSPAVAGQSPVDAEPPAVSVAEENPRPGDPVAVADEPTIPESEDPSSPTAENPESTLLAETSPPPVEKTELTRATGRERIYVWETFHRAERYRKGAGVEVDPKQAAKLYKDVIKRADPDATREAAYRLAQLYSKGPLRDPVAAAEYYKRAADHGSSWAAYTLAGLYKNGVGVARDKKMAKTLYLKALKSNDGGAAKAAQKALGSLAR